LWYSDPWETVELPCAVDAHPTAGLAFSWVLRKRGRVVVDNAINRFEFQQSSKFPQ
jgi:hypothetical protein